MVNNEQVKAKQDVIKNTPAIDKSQLEKVCDLSIELAYLELKRLSLRKRLNKYDRMIQSHAFDIVKKAIPIRLSHQIEDIAELELKITHTNMPNQVEKVAEIAK